MSNQHEYRKLVNEAKDESCPIGWSELSVRLHSIKNLFVVSETTEQGTTSHMFSIRKEADWYREKLVEIVEKTGLRAKISLIVAPFAEESASIRT